MNSTQIVIHIFPHEIDHFEWQSRQLKMSNNYLSKDDKIIIDVTLDFNFVDWSKSTLPKEFFIDKFNQIKSLWDWAETIFDIDESNVCRGCDDKRRNSIRSSTAKNILYLDTDLIFAPETLKYIIDSSKLIPEEYYIISPQTVRMWDDSWDSITNKYCLSTPAKMEVYHANNPFSIFTITNDTVNLIPKNGFKFGGGWFNLFSTKLLKLTDIPDSFGPYGVDDLYVMICCDILKNKGYNIKQYILENLIVTENNKYKQNPYQKYLSCQNLQSEFRTIAEQNLRKEINNFINRI